MDFLKIGELIFHEFDENNDIEIEDGETGYLISIEETKKIIEFLTTQLKNKKETIKYIEKKDTILNRFDECPFSEKTINFYLFIEKKFGTKTPTMFGLYWKFLCENGLINNYLHRITKQRYINWINSRYELNITKLQTNVSKSMLIGLKESLNEFNCV